MTELAGKIRNGDEQAFSQLFHQTHHLVVRYLRNMLDHDGYAQDIAQEAYVRVWQSRAQIDPHQSLKAWLFTIVRNCALTHIKKKLVTQQQLAVFNRDSPDKAPAQNTGEFRLLSDDALALFMKTTKLVPPQFIRCFVLHREHGLTYREIAEREGVSIKTVEKRISVTRQHLRTACQLHENMLLGVFIAGGLQVIAVS